MKHRWTARAGQQPRQFSSRLPGFGQLPLRERTRIAACVGDLSATETQSLENYGSIARELTDTFIENAIGTYSLPLGIATNFLINGSEYLIPMVVEETSVLAAASHAAKMVRGGGGFSAQSTEPIMTGQIQLFLKDDCDFDTVLHEHREQLMATANAGQERLVARGGGVCDLDWKFIAPLATLVVLVHVNSGEAMGANIVNTICERLSAQLLELLPCEVGLQILTNLNDRRRVRAVCEIPAESLSCPRFRGTEVIARIVRAHQFACHDPYRAATNNKGIMNGIDAVVIATGNDWRAVEAGAHAHAVSNGSYQPLAQWSTLGTDCLRGVLELPLAVGTVGGVTKLHPVARAALKILGSPSAQELAEIICCAGLGQNLAALRALSSEGIQRGHLSLHHKNLHQHRQQQDECAIQCVT